MKKSIGKIITTAAVTATCSVIMTGIMTANAVTGTQIREAAGAKIKGHPGSYVVIYPESYVRNETESVTNLRAEETQCSCPCTCSETKVTIKLLDRVTNQRAEGTQCSCPCTCTGTKVTIKLLDRVTNPRAEGIYTEPKAVYEMPWTAAER